ncbi:MAG: hypothetical protein C0608_01065 [Deltaproteobacteria bacterium]|mgnify:CR=1 FL=1|nr:MAG: hypothetical protein C0608_01065 [Deltaproteobacteria bacterium]
MQSLSRKALVTCLLSLVTGIAVILEAMTFPETKGGGFGEGPAFYPTLLAGILIVLGLLTLREPAGKGAEAIEAEEGDEGALPRYGIVSLVVVLSGISIALMKYIGFFASGFSLVLITIFLIRPPKTKMMLISGVLFSAAMIFIIYLLFEVFIGVELPRAAIFNG